MSLIMARINSAVLFLLAGTAFSQQPVPVVVSSGGGWYQSGKLLLRNRTIEPNVPLTSVKNVGDLILDCGTRGWYVYKCAAEGCKPRPCAEADEFGAKISRAMFAHITEMFSPLVRREQAELAVAGVRGSGGPVDAVVYQTAKGVAWAPALARVLEGRYCFRLSHLPAASGSSALTFMLNWDRTVEKEGIAPVPGLAPGLYSLEQAANTSCAVDSSESAAWVLVVPQTAFEQTNKQWEDDSAQVDNLEQTGASVSAVTTLRHAILAWLAEPAQGKQ